MGDQDAYTYSGIAGSPGESYPWFVSKVNSYPATQKKGHAVGWWAQRRQKLSTPMAEKNVRHEADIC